MLRTTSYGIQLKEIEVYIKGSDWSDPNNTLSNILSIRNYTYWGIVFLIEFIFNANLYF